MQQNQPISKLSIGEIIYVQQTLLYSLTFARHDQTA